MNVLPITMPALRARIEDVAALAAHFLRLVAAREGKPAKTLTPEALALLQSYSWPGNVRELQNICERAAVLAAGPSIDATLIAPWLIAAGLGTRSADPSTNGVAPVGGVASPLSRPAAPLVETLPTNLGSDGIPRIACDGTLTLDVIEREAILATLERNRGHRLRSAKDLGIGVRTLGLKLKRWKEEARIPESV